MHCDPHVPDSCFIRAGQDNSHDPVVRHYQCVPPARDTCSKGDDYVCKPLDVVRLGPSGQRFPLCMDFTQHITPEEAASLRRISDWLEVLDRQLYIIWKDQTERRSVEDEKRLPLASMAILLINQCAVNLTERILNLPPGFPMRALFVSTCIGWAMFWKTLFQGSARTKRYRSYIRAPWETIGDLHTAFRSILKLVDLVRHVHNHPERAVVETIGAWVSQGGASDDPHGCNIQRAVNSLIHLLASGRLSDNGDQIAPEFVIPRYNTRNGHLYMYFRDRDREMMCAASTSLIASLLACMMPEEIFGANVDPGHIYVAWVHDGQYTPIETTICNADVYGTIGVSYTYRLPPSRPIVTTPYIYLPMDDLDEYARVSYALDSGDNTRVLAGHRIVSEQFPFTNGTTLLCGGIPVMQLQLLHDSTVLRIEFPSSMTPRALLAFERHYIIRYLGRKLSILPVGHDKVDFITNQTVTPNAYTTTATNNQHIEIMAHDPATLFQIVDAMASIILHMHDPIMVRSGIQTIPLHQTIEDVSSAVLHNIVVGFIQTPSSGSVEVTMKSYLQEGTKPKGRSWARVKNILSTLKTHSIEHTNDRDGSFMYILGIDDHSSRQLADELDTILMQETMGRSRASYMEGIPYTDILDDRVDARLLRADNLVDRQHSVSHLLAYQWYYGISTMKVSDVERGLLDQFEQTARKCTTCMQNTIINLRPVLLEHAHYLDLLGLDRRVSGKRGSSG